MNFIRLRVPIQQASRQLRTLSVPQKQLPRLSLLPSYQQLASYASVGLSKENVQSRVLEILKSFEKVDPAKVCFQTMLCFSILILKLQGRHWFSL